MKREDSTVEIAFASRTALPASIDAGRRPLKELQSMSLGLILLIIVVLLLVGAIPAWPHSRGWGYAPSGGLGLVLVILIVLLVLGRI